jgi:hypothetical protein
LTTVPLSAVSFSLNPGGEGTLILNSSIGKFSAHGKPPPSDINPGVLKYFAAPFRLDGILDLLSRLR